MSAQVFFIDDRNPGMSYISAQGENSSWSQEENVLEFNQTATWTDRGQASVSIPFNGEFNPRTQGMSDTHSFSPL